MTTGNGDLVSLPVDVPVLNPQHLASAAARLQGADDAVVHHRTDIPVFGGLHLRTHIQVMSREWLLSLDDAAARLGVSRSTVNRWRRQTAETDLTR